MTRKRNSGRYGFVSAVLMLAFIAACSSSDNAGTTAAGSVDGSFNTTGIATGVIGIRDDVANAVAIQPNGKIVEAGYSYNGSAGWVFALVRYNADGSLDTTFNATGKVTTAVGIGDDAANAVAVQADGKIVAAGYSYNGLNYDFALVRYNVNGSLDSSFGTGGIVTTPIGAGDDVVNAVAIQPDGKIVAAGYSDNGSSYDFALVRYDTAGNVEMNTTTSIGTGDDVANAVAIQPDGKIVAAGYSDDAGSSNFVFAVVRYNANGSLDTSFKTTGKATTAVGIGAFANSMAIQPDGKIVAAGYSFNGVDNVFALARYTTAGALDTTFNTTGKVTTAIKSGSFAYGVALQADGKIVAAGDTYDGSKDVFALVRYNADGSLDTTFNTTGVITTSIGTGDAVAKAVAVQTDGKLVAAGSYMNGSHEDFALVRYWP